MRRLSDDMECLSPTREAKLHRDLRTLARFIGLYCRLRHAQTEKAPVRVKTHDVDALVGRPVPLCESCHTLLAHAFVKRSTCPFDPKPACKHCPSYCYHPQYRARIQEVMRYSGRRLVLSGRLDYLLPWLF